jgi:heme-degrading monooxygenase HmoA
MHARVTTVPVQLDKADEAIALLRDSVLPAAQKQQGFKGMLSLSDRSSGKGITITLWETEADMTASASSGYLQEQFAKFGEMFAGPPAVESYEVDFQA